MLRSQDLVGDHTQMLVVCKTATESNCGKLLKPEKMLVKSILGYQNINENLRWLREELRYGNNPTDEVKTEMDNPHPNS